MASIRQGEIGPDLFRHACLTREQLSGCVQSLYPHDGSASGTIRRSLRNDLYLLA